MSDVWVLTTRRDGQPPELIRAEDVRHIRIAGVPRRVVALAGPPGGTGTWVELAATPTWAATRRAAGDPLVPELPAEFHLGLIAALGQARATAGAEASGFPVVVHAAVSGRIWAWQADRWDTYMARLTAPSYALS